MDLRQKFGLLALIYVVSLSANLIMSALCIIVYFDKAFRDYQAGAYQEQQVEQARKLLRQQSELLDSSLSTHEIANESGELQRQFKITLDGVRYQLEDQAQAEEIGSLEILVERKDQAFRRWLAARLGGQPGTALDEVRQAIVQLDMRLLRLSSAFGQRRQADMEAAAETQQWVVKILIANSAVGVILCGVGVYYVKRWVMTPIVDLREATKQIAQGNFSFRIEPRARDELGQLAGEVNTMSATISEMQKQLVEQERLAAAGEMVTRLAHNIRNPLAGIRGLAESTAHLHPDDPETVGCQQRIMDTVDRFEKWLRDLQQSVSPMTLNPQPVRIAELLNHVVTALRPMLDRRQVRVTVWVDPGLEQVRLDVMHFEQAVVALVTNAVQASRAGLTVRVEARPAVGQPGRWVLIVQDEGEGIPAEIRQKIFLPYFTTKPDGNGIGLAMASKVVRLHGGELTVESEVGRGSRFQADLPGLIGH